MFLIDVWELWSHTPRVQILALWLLPHVPLGRWLSSVPISLCIEWGNSTYLLASYSKEELMCVKVKTQCLANNILCECWLILLVSTEVFRTIKNGSSLNNWKINSPISVVQSQFSAHSQGVLSSPGFRFFPEKVVPKNQNNPNNGQAKATMKTEVLPTPQLPQNKNKNRKLPMHPQ